MIQKLRYNVKFHKIDELRQLNCFLAKKSLRLIFHLDQPIITEQLQNLLQNKNTY